MKIRMRILGSGRNQISIKPLAIVMALARYLLKNNGRDTWDSTGCVLFTLEHFKRLILLNPCNYLLR